MKKTVLTLALIFSSMAVFAQSEEEILNKWITTYNELSSSGNYDAMISNFEACHSEVPSWDYAYYYKGMAEFNKQDYAAAVKDLSSFTSKVDTVSAAYMMLGKCFNALSQPQDALTYLTIYTQKEPNDKNGYTELSNAHRMLNQYDAYIEDLNKIVSIDPKEEIAYKNIASAYAIQKDYNSAIANYSKAIELNPSNADYYFDRATCRVSLKTPEAVTAALEDFNKAEELGKNDARLYNYKYNCNMMLKNNAGAIEACSKLLEMNPGDLKTLYNRANIYYKDKKYKEAIADMTEVINHEKVDDKTKLGALKTRYMCYKSLNDAQKSNADLEVIKKMEGK